MINRFIYARLLSRVEIGAISIELSKRRLVGQGAKSGPTAHIHVLHPGRTLWGVVRNGGVGFAEAYLNGHWDTDDLTATLEVIARNLDLHVREHPPGWILRTLRSAWQSITARTGSEIPSIGDHYNLGNDFYTTWLDATMTYSSAVFTEDDTDLTTGQIEKYRRIADLADIRPNDRVLEIGCGWGGFAEYVATEIGAHVTGLTLSSEQAIFARDRLAAAGVSGRTKIKLQDFRSETGTYDKVVSIEMIESIPADLWPSLFDQIRDRLRPGGSAAIQAITIDARLFDSLLERDDYISKHIFPGGALPSVDKVSKLAGERGFHITAVAAHAQSYARTLRVWRERFEAAWPTLRRFDLDERFRRAWRYYLSYCEAGFRIGRIDVHQFGFVKQPSAP